MASRDLILALLSQPLVGCYWMIWEPPDDYPETGQYEVVCGAGEIRSTLTGQAFDNLAQAFASAEEQDGFCLGAGEYEIGQLGWQQPAASSAAPSLLLRGAGSDRTILQGPEDYDEGLPSRLHLLAYGDEASVTLEGLSFRDVSLFVDTHTLWAEDLQVGGVHTMNTVLNASARQLNIDGLTMAGSGSFYDVPLRLRGSGTIRGLNIADVVLYQGYLLESYGDLTLVEPQIRGTTAQVDAIGFQAIEAFGPLTVQGGELSGNSTNGPLIYARDKLVLQDVSLVDNAPGWRAVVTLENHALVTGGTVARNDGGSGAFELTMEGSVEFDAVDFGMELDRNRPCDVALNLTGGTHTLCLAAELGPATTISCDAEGCN
jgi:hypothetical protein